MKKQATMKDARGNDVPTYAINPVLKIEDKHSKKIVAAALKAERYLKEVVELTTSAHNEVYQAKLKDAKIKGNKTPYDGMTIGAFDGSIEIKVTKPDNLTFDNTYTKMVKDKFDEYFESFGKDSEEISFLRDVVSDLLYTSGSKIDQNKVLKLRKYRDRLLNSKRLSQNSQIFIDAVDLFDKAIRTKPGNMGIYVSTRDESGKLRPVALSYFKVQL
jgi:hypothetical protein